MEPQQLDAHSLTVVVDLVLTWTIVSLARKLAPDLWESLGSRRKRLVVVAATSTIVAVIMGLVSRMGWAAIASSAAMAFMGAITTRQLVKPNQPTTATMSRSQSLRTKLNVPTPK